MSISPSSPSPSCPALRLVALAGGVGGARLADGLAQVLPAENLTVIVNIGDDFEFMGLKICPDLDTVCYTLSGRANLATGWGLAGETWRTLEGIQELGGPAWFHIGDLDLATHLERTRRLRQGDSLSQITCDFCHAWGVLPRVIPVTDDPVPTIVFTEDGPLPFQEYFVHRQCQPKVTGFRFRDIEAARPAPGVMDALAGADMIVLCPSNPWVSLDPILAVPGIRRLLVCRKQAGVPILALSPIIGGQTVKGPAAKMYAELGYQPSALAVAQHYSSILTGFMMDTVDADQEAPVEALGPRVQLTKALMKDRKDRGRLAEELVEFGRKLLP